MEYSSVLLGLVLRCCAVAVAAGSFGSRIELVEDDAGQLLQMPEDVEAVGDDSGHFLQLPEHLEPGKHGRNRSRDGFWPAVSHVSHLERIPNFLQIMSSTGFKLNAMHLSLRAIRPPWRNRTEKPLASCRTDKIQTVKDLSLKEALNHYCESDLGSLTEFYVDPRFQNNFDRLSDEHGWIPEAFVTYVDLKEDSKRAYKIAHQVNLLARSVHHFSTRPLVVASLGQYLPNEWDAKRFPRMILVHARPILKEYKTFNPIRAMLFTKVANGMIVDGDQIVNTGIDDIFHRTKEEVTRAYPYPILPVNWMARDPEENPSQTAHNWYFKGNSSDLPTRSMRWCHLQPTWTHHALPFIAQWSAWEMQQDIAVPPDWLMEQGSLDAEELLNVALWSANATKQWCKYTSSSANEFEIFLQQATPTKVMSDSKYYPKGVPMVFYSSTNVRDVAAGSEMLEKLWTDQAEVRAPHILYDGHWFSSGAELKKYDRELKCMI